jgi:hypothetical protein
LNADFIAAVNVFDNSSTLRLKPPIAAKAQNTKNVLKIDKIRIAVSMSVPSKRGTGEQSRMGVTAPRFLS